MTLIYMIIEALAATALAKGVAGCNFSEAQQCFGALGKPLWFYLPTDASRKVSLKKNQNVILGLDNNVVNKVQRNYPHRYAYFANGTLLLKNATKSDSGEYQLDIHRSTDGVLLKTIKKIVEIQAPVSKPAVSQMCLSPEVMTVSCFSEGDEAKISFYLDNNLVIPIRAGGTGEDSTSKVTISLPGQLTGSLTCDAENNISRERTVIHLSSCADANYNLRLVTVAAAATTVTLFLVAASFGIYRFKSRNLVTVNGVPEDEIIVYSDVRVVQQTRKTRN